MLEFRLDFWDYATFVVLLLLVTAALVSADVAGGIAEADRHCPQPSRRRSREDDGSAGFLAAMPWIQAFIWAFKPTNIVDIRRSPKAEAEAIAEEIARLRGQTSTSKPPKIDPPGNSPSPES